MALFRKFFHNYKKPPDGLLEISERVYVFNCCFSTDTMDREEYKVYMEGILIQIRHHFPDSSVMLFNFREGESESQTSKILSHCDVTVMDYPRHYEGCPILKIETIHHLLRSCESWLSLGHHNLLVMHCEHGGWPVLAFMLAALMIYIKQHTGEQRTLEMIYKQAPHELLRLLSPLNPMPSQLRYLEYISRRCVASEWPPLDRALTLDSIILRMIPVFDLEGGCRPVFHIYGQDPLFLPDENAKVLFSTPKNSKSVRHYKQADSELVIIHINCHIQGDVVIECINVDKDFEREEMMFRVTFNTAFIRSNILMLGRDQIDTLWDSKDKFVKDFRAEILFSEMETAAPLDPVDLMSIEEKGGLPTGLFDKLHEIFNHLEWGDDIGLSLFSHQKFDDHTAPSPECPNDFAGSEGYAVKETLSSFSSLPNYSSGLSKHSEHHLLSSSIQSPEHIQLNSSVTGQTESRILLPSSLPHPIRPPYPPRPPPPPPPPPNASNCKPSLPPIPRKTNMKMLRPSFNAGTLPRPPIVEPGSGDTIVSLLTLQQQQIASSFPLSPLSLQEGPHPTVSSSSSTTKTHHISRTLHSVTSENKLHTFNDLKTKSTPIFSPPPPPPPPPLVLHPSNCTALCPSPTVKLASRVSAQQVATLPQSTMSSQFKNIQSFDNIAKNPLSTAPPPPPSPPPPPPLPPLVPSAVARIPTPPHLPKKNPTKNVEDVDLSSIRTSYGSTPPENVISTKNAIIEPTSNRCSMPPPPPPPSLENIALAPLPSHKVSSSATGTILPAAPRPPPPPSHHASKQPVISTRMPAAPPMPPVAPPFSSPGSVPVQSKVVSNPSVPPPPKLAPLGARGQTLAHSKSFKSTSAASRRSSLKPLHWVKVTRAVQGTLWAETQNSEEAAKAPQIDISELESLFSANSDANSMAEKAKRRSSLGGKSDKVHLIDMRRANNCEIMLTKVKMPIPDLMSALLALDDSILDADQIDNLIKYCPTKEEMELLQSYTGDRENLGKCEQFFLELMKVPRVEAKFRVLSFKIEFPYKVAELRSTLNIVNSTADEVRNSVKLKRIMQTILSLGNALNQGTARGSAIGFRLDSLLKLADIRARNNKMTLMHYLCKVLEDKLPEVLDFDKDLVNLEAASKTQLKILAEEMQAISKGLEKVVHELRSSENDGPVSQTFPMTLKKFLSVAEADVASLTTLYNSVGKKADSLAFYFGEDPARCPFEQVVSTLFNFTKMFARAHAENLKQAEMEKKKMQKEACSEKPKDALQKKESPVASPVKKTSPKVSPVKSNES